MDPYKPLQTIHSEQVIYTIHVLFLVIKCLNRGHVLDFDILYYKVHTAYYDSNNLKIRFL